MLLSDLTVLDPVINAIGWALLHFVWQGLLIGLIFRLGTYTLSLSHPNIRYAFGLICMLSLLIAPVLTGYMACRGTAPASAVTSWSSEAASSEMLKSDSVLAAELASIAESWAAPSLPVIVILWLSGVAWMTLRVGLNWYRMLRLSRVGITPVPAMLQAKTVELLQLFGIRATVRVFESTLIQVPTLLGWLKPVILLPTSSLAGLTPLQLELVIAHELSHIRRLDFVVNLLQVLVETLLFYHPVVRWISQQVRDEREKCCDDLVISYCKNRVEYAKALNNLAVIRNGEMNLALGATQGQLLQRIKRIAAKDGEHPGPDHSNLLAALTLAVTVIMAGKTANLASRLGIEQAVLSEELVVEFIFNRIPDLTRALIVPLGRAAELVLSYSEALPKSAERGMDGVGSNATEANRQPQAGAESLPLIEAHVFEQAQLHAELESMEVQAEPVPVDVAAELSRITANLVIDKRAESATDIVAVAGPTPLVRTISTDILTPFNQALERVNEVASERQLQEPKLVRQVTPLYPGRAIYAKEDGFVRIEFSISQDGRPIDLKVLESEPNYLLFEREAYKALRYWRFDPDTVEPFDGQRFTQSFTFKYDDVQRRPFCDDQTGSRLCR